MENNSEQAIADSRRLPTAAEIRAAEQRLGRNFHPEYREFLLGGGDVADAALEPAVVAPTGDDLDLVMLATTAWEVMGVPTGLLPFVEDNGDYYCLTEKGEVVYWSHNGVANQRWPSIDAWRHDVCVQQR